MPLHEAPASSSHANVSHKVRPAVSSPQPTLLIAASVCSAILGIASAMAAESDPSPAERPGCATVVASATEAPRHEDDSAPVEAPPPSTTAQGLMEERVRVVGSAAGVSEVAGSAEFIGPEELARQQYTDVQRILRRVPGVYLQDEDGFGLRPNIGMRGTGVERSQKVTLLEDGTLIAPAPYSAPAAYYVPTVGRMSAIEVSKGAASIEQGPFTTGGVINMISEPIPLRFGGRLDLAAGGDGYGRGRLDVGDSRERFGWLIEAWRERTQGFKRLDGGGDTGFDLADYRGKLRVNSREGARVYQSLEIKVGATNQDGDETYLGLTTEDFRRNPYRRYVASSLDRIVTDHEQRQLRHFIAPAAWVDLTTTVYEHDFHRNWFKLERAGSTSVAGVLAAPESHAEALSILRGETDSAPGFLQFRNNRRAYVSRGIQSTLALHLASPSVKHAVEVGVRLHRDEEDRYQEDDTYQMVDGRLALTALGTPASQANRIASAQALAAFVRDTIAVGRWTLSPGLRLEQIDFTQQDYGLADPERNGAGLNTRRSDVSALIPGLGVDYRLNDSWRVFGGLHRGFAPPGPGQDRAVDPEESLNTELGLRFLGASAGLQAVVFYNDYENLLGRDTVSGGGDGSGDLFNGGAARLSGLEFSWHDEHRLGDRLSMPYRVSYTYTQAEFASSFQTAFEDWAPQVRRGDEIPYLPHHQGNAEFGLRGTAWGLYLNASALGPTRTRAGQGAIPEAERIGDHLIFDLSADYTFDSRYRTFLQVRNLTDEIYVAARRPAGLRPGLPRTLLAGFGLRF